MGLKKFVMSYISDHQQKFNDLTFQIENQDQIRRTANGGNSILFSYPPEEESLYLQKAKELFSNKAEFIDISKLLVAYIDQDGWEDFAEYYKDFQDTPHKVFRSDDPAVDLFDMIIQAIVKASADEKLPFLVRTGCLLGTGIENVNIMEHKQVMSLKHPLVIFYPSKIVDGAPYFLNFKPASNYRCTVVK